MVDKSEISFWKWSWVEPGQIVQYESRYGCFEDSNIRFQWSFLTIEGQDNLQSFWAADSERSKMTKPVSCFMSVLDLLNVTLIQVDWPMPCWRTLSELNGLTLSKFQTQVTSLSPGLRYQFQHEAWRHYIEYRYNQVVLQSVNLLLGHSWCGWSEDQIIRADRTHK